MADINEMRKLFYEEDDAAAKPYTLGSSSTAAAGTAGASSSTGPARRSAGANAASSSSSSSSAAAMGTTSGTRPSPYPKRPSDGRGTGRRGGGAGGNGYGEGSGGARSGSSKRKDLSFIERARAAPDDDDLYGSGLGGAGAMDVDVSHPNLGSGLGLGSRLRDGTGEESDVAQLMRAWQNERHAPDILPSADALLVRVLDAIRRQSEDASALRSAAHMSEEEHYMTMLVQTEVERIKFVVRSYVRTRLFKIETHAAHITSTPTLHPRLTAAELAHAQRYAALTVSQFTHTLLAHLPDAQQALDDEVITIPNMITEPNKDKPVFCHTFDTLPALMLRDGTTIEVARDAVIMVPYRTIEQLLLRGEVELV